MATHLICITETRDFVYEVEVDAPNDRTTQITAKVAAQTIHRGKSVTTPKVVAVTCSRARPIKRTAEWIAHRDGSI